MGMKYLEVTEDKHKKNLDIINKHVASGKNTIIALTAPWCGHCTALKPILNEMKTKLNSSDTIFANVSDKYHSKLKIDTDVDGFPTIRKFKGSSKIADFY